MKQNRPNIIYILSDDLGVGDVSCLNPGSKIQTPRLDKLAGEGMVFSDAHSNSAVCTPTRYGILTGRYAWRSRLKGGVLGGYSRELLEEGRMTVAGFLRGNGYRTACVGKWHLGLGWKMQDGTPVPIEARGMADPGVDFAAGVDQGPHTAGFEESSILPGSLDLAPYCTIEDGRVVEIPTLECKMSPRPAFWRGGLRAPGFNHEQYLDDVTARACEVIRRHSTNAGTDPLFLYLALPSPHTPHLPGEAFRGKSSCGEYGDYVVRHDDAIGRVLDALDQAGMRDSSLVIVTSDNGAHRSGDGFDFEREFGHRSNAIYRGQKADAWDGGHRIPFIARWPGQIPVGTTCGQTICLTDLFATCADLLGAELPAGCAEDSISMLGLLRGDTETATRLGVVHTSYCCRHALRWGRWKYIQDGGGGGFDTPAPGDIDHVQLYDMAEDPEEETNLADRHPERVEELAGILRRALESEDTRFMGAKQGARIQRGR